MPSLTPVGRYHTAAVTSLRHLCGLPITRSAFISTAADAFLRIWAVQDEQYPNQTPSNTLTCAYEQQLPAAVTCAGSHPQLPLFAVGDVRGVVECFYVTLTKSEGEGIENSALRCVLLASDVTHSCAVTSVEFAPFHSRAGAAQPLDGSAPPLLCSFSAQDGRICIYDTRAGVGEDSGRNFSGEVHHPLPVIAHATVADAAAVQWRSDIPTGEAELIVTTHSGHIYSLPTARLRELLKVRV